MLAGEGVYGRLLPLSDVGPDITIDHEARDSEGRLEPAPASPSLQPRQEVEGAEPLATEQHTHLAQDSEQRKGETQQKRQPGPAEVSQETVGNMSELQWHLVPCTDLCSLTAAACLLPSKSHPDFSCAQS